MHSKEIIEAMCEHNQQYGYMYPYILCTYTYERVTYANILHTSELHQFQFVTAYKFVHQDQKNYETKERTVNHVYFSAHSKF